MLIVGGGRLALEKVRGLQAAEADLTLIAPDLIDELRDLRDSGAIAHLPRDYRDGDMAGCALVMAADDSGRDPGLNARLQREGRGSAGFWSTRRTIRRTAISSCRRWCATVR